MKKLILLSAILILGCKNTNQIRITKVEGSTEYENAKLSLKESSWTDEGYLFSFDLESSSNLNSILQNPLTAPVGNPSLLRVKGGRA